MTKGPAILSFKLWFPPAEEADHEGLIAIGGDLGIDRLLMAYRNGIFPGMMAAYHCGGAPIRVLFYTRRN